MSQETEAFVQRLVAANPDLQPLLDEHLEDNFGELLPHLWTSDLARHVVARFQSDGPDAVAPLLEQLDKEAGRDPEVDEVLGVSLVELLPDPGEPGAEVADLLGPRLTSMLHEQRS
jgi:hypothetical protein